MIPSTAKKSNDEIKLDLMAAVKFSNHLYLPDKLIDESIKFISENPSDVETKLKGIDRQHADFYRYLEVPELTYLVIRDDDSLFSEEEQKLFLQETNEAFPEFPLTRSMETTASDVTFAYIWESESRGQILFDINFNKYLNNVVDSENIESDKYPNTKRFLKSLQSFNNKKSRSLVSIYRMISSWQSGFFKLFDKARMIKLDQNDLSYHLDINQSKISRMLSGRHCEVINKEGYHLNIYVDNLMPNKKQIKRFYAGGALNGIFLDEMRERTANSDRVLAEKIGAERRLVAKLREESAVPGNFARGKAYRLDKNQFYTIEY